jgi:hypothetical protein
MIKAERPLALMFMEISPKYRPPMTARETAQVSTPGQKKGIFGRVRQNRGRTLLKTPQFERLAKNRPLKSKHRSASLAVRCYEPEVLEICDSGGDAPVLAPYPENHASVILRDVGVTN